ncbi:MAG: HlyD family efflux transporter periplasmic adaptor subunit [Mameliella sp.]|nr:HlyD family efflux transporter periplasmic adaptor subunit [Phaeodactylibacter sp.]NRA52267.1 HlyD family efflux transporter periplasmic adaptor subunit [Phaeodactylibacter sp.]
MQRSGIIFLIALLGLTGLLGWYFLSDSPTTEQDKELRFEVKKLPFTIQVTATGELAAKRSVKIRAPQGMRAAGIYETTLSDLVPEGSVVNAGDYVASLDRTELAGKMSDVQTELEKVQTQLEQARIDTAIELRGLRDELANLEFTKQEKLLAVDQSRYEPKSVIQQAELDLERTERDFRQLLKKYELKQQQAIAKIQEIDALLRQNQRQLKVYTDLSAEFRINAPESGMVIYARSWRGKKEPGSRISAWDPIVAELPDLNDMISQTYVNEVDISKVQEGQDVDIQVDAFPDRKYTGKVIKVANIGEQLSGYDAKVFEVIVQVNESDSILRPAMTTSNEILTGTYKDVLAIPLEGLQSDSLAFVYKTSGNSVVRQEVITGLSNADEIIIAHGLAEGDQVFLVPPPGAEEAYFIPVDPKIKAEIEKKQKEEEAKRQAEALRRKESVKNIPPPSTGNQGGGGFFIID